MNDNGIELRILIGGKPITEYKTNKDGPQTFVEGRQGSEYEIELYNTTYSKVEAVISVDGRSVVDGKLAGTTSTGYILNARQKIKIPGFLVNGDTAAKFTFGSPKASYAAQMSGGDTANIGVIGVRVYSEKYRQWPDLRSTLMMNSPLLSSCTTSNSLGGLGSRASRPTKMASDDRPRGITPSGEVEYQEQSIGTEFGAATDFKTKTVSFNRGDHLTTLALYYDDRKSLEKRGIVVEQYNTRTKPNPFPADIGGCEVPPGWSSVK